ncbi:unnamed protein product [Heligmosomoides polygyrus]|uniref:G protein-coupled receptor n=1 Tax=Heligmosomoides polygyrus TaxID=6339 RepID=A0A183GKV0_HELPZ|nr:unnamed protein product [Heligmosomoides polygyrus]
MLNTNPTPVSPSTAGDHPYRQPGRPVRITDLAHTSLRGGLSILRDKSDKRDWGDCGDGCSVVSDLSYLYTSWRWILLICIVNLTLLANYGCLLVMSSLPKEAFKAQIYAEFPEIDSYAFHSSNNSLSGFFGADFVVMTVSLACIGVYCAVRIHLYLKQCGLNSNVKRLQRQMFRVLLAQTACPTLLICFPESATHVILFGGVHTSQSFADGLGVLTSLYPLFNPLVTMLSITDYRRYLFTLFLSRKSSSGVQRPRTAMAWMKRSAK